jgi:hypothetical protein
MRSQRRRWSRRRALTSRLCSVTGSPCPVRSRESGILAVSSRFSRYRTRERARPSRARSGAQISVLEEIAVGEAHVGAEVLGRGADVVPQLVGVGDQRLGNAVMAHEPAGELPVLFDLGGVARGIVGHRVEHGHGRARATLDGGGEADVVEMVVRREQQLDVLDAQPLLAQARLERRERVVVARPRVDQRDRIAAQQPGVDRPDVGQRKGDGDHGVHELTSVWHISSSCGGMTTGLAISASTCIIN